MATAFEERAPGIELLEISLQMAGRGGRSRSVEFTAWVATALGWRAPGMSPWEFTICMAGRSGRICAMEFIQNMATAFVFIAARPRSARACVRTRAGRAQL